MRIYYEMTVWDEVDDEDTEKLKTKAGEFVKRLQGYGILKYSMQAAPQAQAPQEVAYTEEELRQIQAEQEAQATEEAPEQPPQQPQPEVEPVVDE